MISFIYILLVVSLILTVFCVLLTVLAIRSNSNKTSTIQTPDNTEKIKILLEKDSIENIDNMVDEIIKRSADRYMILNVNFKELPYITERDTDELTKYIFGSVKMDMTDTVEETIGLIHNISTEKQLDDFLNLRIKMYVLALLVKTNQTINE